MAKQEINVGAFAGDTSAEAICTGGIKINDNFNELYDTRLHYVTDYGAIGNSSHSTAGGNDDTTAIQAAYTEAAAAGGRAAVVYTGRRSYRITATINVPLGVRSIGEGGQSADGIHNPPMVVWDGADLGTMFKVEAAGAGFASITNASFENLCIRGVDNISNKPGKLLHYTATGGSAAKIESSTYLKDVWLQGCNGNGLHIDTLGSANFYILGGRWDGIYGGYGIYVDLNGGGHNFYATIISPTWVGGHPTTNGKGFMFLDGETVSTWGSSSVLIYGLHTEQNTPYLETFAAGANPYDKRGTIRLGVTPALFGIQHRVCITGWEHNHTATDASHCAFQITATSGTDQEASECVSCHVYNGSGLQEGNTDANAVGELRMFGGKVPAAQRFPFRGYRHGTVIWGRGKDSGSDFEQLFSYVNTHFRVRGLEIQDSTVANLPTGLVGNTLMYVTDSNSTTLGATVAGGGSNKVLVFHNGANWKIFAVVN